MARRLFEYSLFVLLALGLLGCDSAVSVSKADGSLRDDAATTDLLTTSDSLAPDAGLDTLGAGDTSGVDSLGDLGLTDSPDAVPDSTPDSNVPPDSSLAPDTGSTLDSEPTPDSDATPGPDLEGDLVGPDSSAPQPTLAIELGDNQKATVASVLPVTPTVKVTDGNGAPLAGVSVSFAIESGGGTLVGTQTLTNDDGLAWIASWTLGQTVGENRLVATVGTEKVTFVATATPGPAQSLVAEPEALIEALVATTSSLTFRVRDAYQNHVADGTQLGFRLVQGGGKLQSTSGVTKDGTVTVKLDNSSKLGSSVVEAQLGALTARITVVRRAGPPTRIESVKETLGASANGAISFEARVSDAYGNPVSGVAVTFKTAFDDSAPVTVETNEGIAVYSLLAPTRAGSYWYTASLADGTTTGFLVSVGAGPLFRVIPYYADYATLIAGQRYKFWIRGLDQYGNPVNLNVKLGDCNLNTSLYTTTYWSFQQYLDGLSYFQVDAQLVLITPASGTLYTLMSCTLAGGVTYDLKGFINSAESRTLTIESPAPDTPVLPGASVTVGVLVKTTGGAVVNGAKVYLRRIAGRGLFANGQELITLTTGANGKASTTFVSDTEVPGTNEISFETEGDLTPTTPVFHEGRHITIGLLHSDPTRIVHASSPGSSVIAGSPQTLVVSTLDGNGWPTNGGFDVIWTVESGDGSFGGEQQKTTQTASGGSTSIALTTGKPGVVVVKATLGGTGQSVLFTVNAITGAPAKLTLDLQSYRMLPVSSELTLVATVSDKNGNPVRDVPLLFGQFGLGQFIDPTSVETALDGTASVRFQTSDLGNQETQILVRSDTLEASVSFVTAPGVSRPTPSQLEIAPTVTELVFVPNAEQLAFISQVAFHDGTARYGLHTLKLSDGALQIVDPALSFTKLGGLLATPDGKRLVALYEAGSERGVLIYQLASGALTRVPRPVEAVYDLTLSADGTLAFFSEQKPTSIKGCSVTPDWVETRTMWRQQLELAAPTPAPQLVGSFTTSGLVSQPPFACGSAPTKPFNASVSCDGASFALGNGSLFFRSASGLTQTLSTTAGDLRRLVQANGDCLVTYRETSTNALTALSVVGDSVTPKTIFTFPALREYLFAPALDTLLYTTDGGPLELVKPLATTKLTLSPAPQSGAINALRIAPGGQLALFTSQLLRQHVELFVSDLQSPSPASTVRVSQYLPDDGTRRDVGDVQLFPDGSGLIFIQSSDTENLIKRPFVVRFADIPASEQDGAPFAPFAFGNQGFATPGQLVIAFSLGADSYAAFIANAYTVGSYHLFVVERQTQKTRALYTLPGKQFAAPIWSANGQWLALKTSSSGQLLVVDVPERLTELTPLD